jgi:hypothetical protein
LMHGSWMPVNMIDIALENRSIWLMEMLSLDTWKLNAGQYDWYCIGEPVNMIDGNVVIGCMEAECRSIWLILKLRIGWQNCIELEMTPWPTYTLSTHNENHFWAMEWLWSWEPVNMIDGNVVIGCMEAECWSIWLTLKLKISQYDWWKCCHWSWIPVNMIDIEVENRLAKLHRAGNDPVTYIHTQYT